MMDKIKKVTNTKTKKIIFWIVIIFVLFFILIPTTQAFWPRAASVLFAIGRWIVTSLPGWVATAWRALSGSRLLWGIFGVAGISNLETIVKVAQIADDATGGILTGGADFFFGNPLQWLAWIIFEIAKWLFSISGVVFDFMIELSLRNDFYRLEFIEVAWKTFRDIGNMVFIFAILYLAIVTILRAGGANVGKSLATIIMAALFINFSLAFSRVVIDASNVLGRAFLIGASTDGKLSTAFIEGFAFQDKLLGDADAAIQWFKGYGMSNTKIALTYMGSSFFLIVAAFTFLSGGIVFVIRTAYVALLMVFSPLAFAAMAFPGSRIGNYASEWVSSLLNQAFVAPVYLSVIWVAVLILKSPGFLGFTSKGNGSYADIFSIPPAAVATGAGVSYVSIIFGYVFILTLLVAAVIIAKTMAPKAAAIAQETAGKMVFGGTALAGRQVLGRLAKNAGSAYGDDLKKISEDQSRSFLTRSAANLARKGISNASTGSFDLRGTGAISGMGMEAGKVTGEGGFVKEGDLLKQLTTPPKETALEASLKKEGKEEATEARDDAEKARIKSQENFISAISTTNVPQAADVTKIRDMSDSDIRRMVKDNKDFFTNKEFVKHLTASQLEAIAKSGELDRSVMADIADAVKQKYANGPATDETDYLNNSPAAHKWRR